MLIKKKRGEGPCNTFNSIAHPNSRPLSIICHSSLCATKEGKIGKWKIPTLFPVHPFLADSERGKKKKKTLFIWDPHTNMHYLFFFFSSNFSLQSSKENTSFSSLFLSSPSQNHSNQTLPNRRHLAWGGVNLQKASAFLHIFP